MSGRYLSSGAAAAIAGIARSNRNQRKPVEAGDATKAMHNPVGAGDARDEAKIMRKPIEAGDASKAMRNPVEAGDASKAMHKPVGAGDARDEASRNAWITNAVPRE